MMQHAQFRPESMQPSDEATEQELYLARVQGDAVDRALRHMMDDVAESSGEKVAGDYRIGFVVEPAEGMYVPRDGKLEWMGPGDANAHIEISVRDSIDGRFLPGLTVHATLIDETGIEVGTHHQPFVWHPWIFHYGRNWRVPGDGTYTLRVRVEPPSFPRHDKLNGQRYTEPAEVEFKDVHIQTGRKA